MTGFFKGDDLIDVITINRPKNTDDITIKKAILQVGTLEPFIEVNPVFPYSISIMRDKSSRLNHLNPIYLGIIYDDENGHENVKRTCVGSLTLAVNNQVVMDVSNG